MSPIVVTNSSPSGRVKRVKAPTPASGASPFFEDSFAGGATNPSGGFTYSNSLGGLEYSAIVAVGDSGAQVKGGYTHSLRTRYLAQAIGLQGGNGQVNFTLGRECDSLWLEWEVYVPSNYTHRNNYTPAGPPVDPLTDNNKFIHLWGNSYSSGYHQPNVELNNNGVTLDNPSDGKSYVLAKMRYSADQGSGFAGLNMEIDSGNPVLVGASSPMVPGTWNTVRYYTKKETTLGAADGVWKLWVNGSVVLNLTGLKMGASDPAKYATGCEYGYFLGAANSGFTEQTDFFTQWVKFYDTNPGW
jgi:hypothetical protein